VVLSKSSALERVVGAHLRQGDFACLYFRFLAQADRHCAAHCQTHRLTHAVLVLLDHMCQASCDTNMQSAGITRVCASEVHGYLLVMLFNAATCLGCSR
jgi:hypothetical protein